MSAHALALVRTSLDHPVLDVLRTRRAGGSRPSSRRDEAVVALVLEGGGMRGVVSSAMAAALQRAGLTACFDRVVGTSAGALNGAAFLAGVAEGCTGSYCDDAVVRRYIARRRLLVGRPAVDVTFVLRHATHALDADRHRRTVESPIPLHCVAVDIETAESVDLTDLRSVADLRQALLASSRLPWIGGHPVEFRGRRYLDGGLAEPVPLRTALAAGATHALVLQTRPAGVPRSISSGPVESLIERHLRRLNPRLVDLLRHRTDAYDAAVADVARRSRNPSDAPYVLGLRLPPGARVVAQLERRPALLEAAARAAALQVAKVLHPLEARP